MLFPAPTKKGRKRKAQREEDRSDKSRRMLTSKEVRGFGLGFGLKLHPGLESREEKSISGDTLSKTEGLELNSRNPRPSGLVEGSETASVGPLDEHPRVHVLSFRSFHRFSQMWTVL